MRKIISALLIFALLIALLVGAMAALLLTSYVKYEDVRYGELGCEVMDVYVPKGASKRESVGCVLFIHGGSWSSGDKREEELRCRAIASRGYVTATMNYTLRSDANADGYSVELVLDEIDMVLAKIKAFAKELGVNVTEAATAGYSAGAHLSMLYSFSRKDTAPLEIKFTANLAGPADMSREVWGDGAARTIGEWLTGERITDEMMKNGDADALLEKISPTSYVNSNTPPSIFVYGGKDNVVSIENGESVKAAFDAAGVEYDYIFLPDSDHALIQNPIKRLSYIVRVAEYCDRYFK